MSRAVSRVAGCIANDVPAVRSEVPALAILKVKPQGFGDYRKGDFCPGNIRFVVEGNVEALASGTEVFLDQPRAVHHVYLIDVRQVKYRIQVTDLDMRRRFLVGLSRSPFLRGFVIFHEPGGQRP